MPVNSEYLSTMCNYFCKRLDFIDKCLLLILKNDRNHSGKERSSLILHLKIIEKL